MLKVAGKEVSEIVILSLDVKKKACRPGEIHEMLLNFLAQFSGATKSHYDYNTATISI